MKVYNFDTACKRLRSSGLSQQQTHSILNLIQKWVKSNGEEWTVKRLKALKTAFVRKLAGESQVFSLTPWLAYHKDMTPKGPFRQIFNLGKRKPQKALSALMVYSGYISKEATRQQVDKFVSAVTEVNESLQTEQYKQIRRNVVRQARNLVQSLQPETKNRLSTCSHMPIEVWSQREVRIPCYRPMEDDMLEPINWNQWTPTDKLVTRENNLEDFVASFNHPMVQKYFKEAKIARHLVDSYETTLDTAAFQGSPFVDNDQEVVGRIGLIQEPGFKLRTVANPFPSIQVALSRLGTMLYSLLKEVEEDCTFDQESATKAVQSFMIANPTLKIMSIDLSSATDRFPLDLQLAVLRKFGLAHKVDVSLFESVAKAKWSFRDETITWQTGQPLGVYPSFALFAFTHHMLARTCKPKFYRILGDDIIIDEEAGKRLRQIYNNIGLKISEDKSLNSSQLAEFGGRLITNDKFFVQPKWKQISDRSFIDLARNLGPKSLGLFTREQRKVLKVLANVHPDVHPWGLNWNTDGLDYNTRVLYSQEVMQRFLLNEEVLQSSKNQIELSNLKYQLQLQSMQDFKVLSYTRSLQDDDQVDDYLKSLKSVYAMSHAIKLKHVHSLNEEKEIQADIRRRLDRKIESAFKAAEDSYKLSQFGDNAMDPKIEKQFAEIDSLISAMTGTIQATTSRKTVAKGSKILDDTSLPSGDPRGKTTLEVAKKKLKLPKGNKSIYPKL